MGCPLVSASVPTEMSNGMITNGTGFESAPFGPGFRTWIVEVAAEATSAGFSPVAQLVAAAQVVPRGAIDQNDGSRNAAAGDKSSSLHGQRKTFDRSRENARWQDDFDGRAAGDRHRGAGRLAGVRGASG